MTLRARLTVAIVVLVGVTALLAWTIAGRAVVRPLASAMFDTWVDEALYVAQQLEVGADADVLEDGLDVRIHVLPDFPQDPNAELPRRREHRARSEGRERRERRAPTDTAWRKLERDGRTVWFRPGPRNRVVVESDEGYVAVVRDLDLERPERRLSGWLLGGTVPIVLVASWIASRTVRPVVAAQDAMLRVAGGDLEHRLDEEGPPELRQMARTFNGMAEEITRRIRAERQLMAGLSHELRTPLTRLRLELELLRDSGAPATRVDAMEADLSEVDALLGELLELSRLEFGQVPVERAPVDGRALIDDPAVEVRGDATYVGDERLLRRAVGNLVSNSRRHAPGARVIVTLEPGRIVVEDDGPGVPDADLPRLFEPFWRGGAQGRARGGLGLGLMIVREIAALHGGGVTATNRPEGGLRVVLALGSA